MTLNANDTQTGNTDTTTSDVSDTSTQTVDLNKDTSAATTTPSGTATATVTDTSTDTSGKAGDSSTKGKDTGDAKQQPAAPEKYELKLPDGVPMLAEEAQELIDKAATDAKARGLSQEQANAVLGDRAEVVKQHREIVNGWAEEVKADTEFGGANLANTEKHSKAALAKFFPEITAEMLNKTGIGNHPGFVRGLARIGRAMQPDGHVAAGDPQPAKKTTKELWYPDLAAGKK